MATTAEGKPEAKQEAKQEPRPEAKEPVVVEENPEPPLKYKTWVLKVSVHCEGCRKKVEKILKNIEGVYTTKVDLRQQKVTVIGNVDADTLIKKLIKKTGKHAALWPEKAEQKEKKQGKSKNKEKQSDPENSEEASHGGEKEKETAKGEVPASQDAAKNSENGSSVKIVEGGNVNKANEGGGAAGKAGGPVKESKPEVNQAATPPASNQSPVAEKKVGGDSEGGVEKGAGGSGGKKKKKKGQKGNVAIGGEDAPAGTGLPAQGQEPHYAPVQHPANYGRPRHHFCEYPPQYHAPPVYAVSYSTAYPSYSASYYTSPAPYSCSYVHSGTMNEPPPSDLDSYASQPSDSFEIFSDENPNACSIM